MADTLSTLNNLSEEERKIALQILGELSEKGSSEYYDELKYADYKEIPVDIETFLRDPQFLANGLTDSEGRFTVFPYWIDTLKKIFPDNLNTAYNTLILTGGIGLGKSLCAVLCLNYLIYRMLCLKDPYLHYGLMPSDKITFSLLNSISIDASSGVAWDKMQQLFQTSPWFLSHGNLRGRTNVVWEPPKGIELVIGSSNNAVIGRALFGNFTDEVNFSAMTADIEKIKKKHVVLISQIDARMSSRFGKSGKTLPTLNIIASSKNNDQSFLDSFIETKKEINSKTTLIIDEPQWVIRNDKNCDKKFYVAVGNRFLASELIPLDSPMAVVENYRNKGYEILEIPALPDYIEQFQGNVEQSLNDIAGISTTNAYKFISGVRWGEIKTTSYQNPFVKDTIVVGDSLDDTAEYKDFFDIARIPGEYFSKPMFIHMDMSKKGDKTGIAGVWVVGKKPSPNGDSSRELLYKVAFSVSIEAPKGCEISFEKNRNFIRWLRQQGLNIRGVSSDTYQSAQIQQQLRAERFDTKIISVDRLENVENGKHKICLPYQFLKSAIYEHRLVCYADCELLTTEIMGLEKEPDGHINHPDNGASGSKDQADAVCGALFNASQHAEEFAYDYGESIDAILEVAESTEDNLKQQLTVDFEEELKRVMLRNTNSQPPSTQTTNQRLNNKDLYTNFGFGKAQEYDFANIADGIMIW